MGGDSDFTIENLPSDSGASLRLYTLAAATEYPRAVVQINHGLAEHAGRYQRFARFLSARGFHVYAHDHRGHGHTHAPDASLGVFADAPPGGGWQTVLDDVAAVRRHIAATHPGLPVVCFGHSMGGLIAFSYALRWPLGLAGLAIWNSSFAGGAQTTAAKTVLATERILLGPEKPSRVLPAITFRAWNGKFKPNRTAFDWLSRDDAEVDAYVADPLCGFDASVSMWRDLFVGVEAGADAANFTTLPKDLPIHLVGGEHDPATEGGKAVRVMDNRLRRAGFSNVSCTVYTDTRHETLNELNRDKAQEDFAAWLDEVLGGISAPNP